MSFRRTVGVHAFWLAESIAGPELSHEGLRSRDPLASVDLSVVPDIVVKKIGGEYGSMDESFDSETVRQAASLAIQIAQELVNGTTMPGEEQ